jgi:hypothetical protein
MSCSLCSRLGAQADACARRVRCGWNLARLSEDHVTARKTVAANLEPARPQRSALEHATVRKRLGGRDGDRDRPGRSADHCLRLYRNRLASHFLGSREPRPRKIRQLGQYDFVVGICRRIIGGILVFQRCSIQKQIEAQRADRRDSISTLNRLA